MKIIMKILDVLAPIVLIIFLLVSCNSALDSMAEDHGKVLRYQRDRHIVCDNGINTGWGSYNIHEGYLIHTEGSKQTLRKLPEDITCTIDIKVTSIPSY